MTKHTQPPEDNVSATLLAVAATPPLTKWTQVDSTGISLNDNDGGRILTISKDEGGMVTFGEACDYYFSVSVSKEDAKRALLEALAWLER